MAILEVDKDKMMEIFESKENVKKSVYAVMDNRLTAAHLSADVFALIEMLDKLEIVLIGEPLVQEVPKAIEVQTPTAETPAPQPEQSQEPVPEVQTQPEQSPTQS
jgi:hypothetical protein